MMSRLPALRFSRYRSPGADQRTRSLERERGGGRVAANACWALPACLGDTVAIFNV